MKYVEFEGDIRNGSGEFIGSLVRCPECEGLWVQQGGFKYIKKVDVEREDGTIICPVCKKEIHTDHLADW